MPLYVLRKYPARVFFFALGLPLIHTSWTFESDFHLHGGVEKQVECGAARSEDGDTMDSWGLTLLYVGTHLLHLDIRPRNPPAIAQA